MSTLAEWMTPLPDAAAMHAVDRWAIEERGIDGLALMERAGAAVAAAAEALVADGPVTVFCGKGNNGGDGLVVARLLRDAGRDVSVVCVTDPQAFGGDARANLERLAGPPPLRVDGRPWEVPAERAAEGADGLEQLLGASVLVVDALLGTGSSGEPRGAVAEAIAAINACTRPVISVDVPSGVDASSGGAEGLAVAATQTVTFHAAKPGLWIRPGKGFAGVSEVVDIGIPRGAPSGASVGLIEPRVCELLPRRGADSTKFSSGHVFVVGGSAGLSGAPAIASLASMRAGAGYVTACVPSSLQAIIATIATPELMSRGLTEGEGSLSAEAAGEVLTLLQRGGALVLGPGLGRGGQAPEFARRLAREAPVAMVLDADGLNAHAGRLPELAARSLPTVLTPHAGELGRLLELDSAAIERERLRCVREAARQAECVVVLKGDDTLIADPEGLVAVSRGASPALATAGTGDALAGVIGALLAQEVEPFVAAAAGVWLHAEAGREAARRVGAAEGVIATDVVAALPGARFAAASEGRGSRVFRGG